MEIADPLICLLWNLYAGKEATVRTGHRTMNWFKLGKEYVKAVYCHSGYLTYMQSVVQSFGGVQLFVIPWTAACQASLSFTISWSRRVHHMKCQAGLSTSWNQDCGRSINNLGYADHTTLVAESEEELKSLLMKVKEESGKAGLKLNIQKAKFMAASSIT